MKSNENSDVDAGFDLLDHPLKEVMPNTRGILLGAEPRIGDPIKWSAPSSLSAGTWPWYTSLAPASWLTSADVNSARARFNTSELTSRGSIGGFGNGNDIRQRIESGTLPPSDYLLLHPAARRTDAEMQELIQSLENSLR